MSPRKIETSTIDKSIQDQITSLIQKIGIEIWEKKETLHLKAIDQSRYPVASPRYFVYSYTEEWPWMEIEESHENGVGYKPVKRSGMATFTIYVGPTFIMEIEYPIGYGHDFCGNLTVGYLNRKEILEIINEYEIETEAANLFREFMAFEEKIDLFFNRREKE